MRGHVVITGALLMVSMAFTLLALPLSRTAATVPLAVGVLTTGLIAASLVKDRREEGSSVTSSETVLVVWFAALLATIYVFGFALALSAFASLYWRLRAEGSWRAASAIAAGVFVFLYGGLILLLRIDLFPGIVWR